MLRGFFSSESVVSLFVLVDRISSFRWGAFAFGLVWLLFSCFVEDIQFSAFHLFSHNLRIGDRSQTF